MRVAGSRLKIEDRSNAEDSRSVPQMMNVRNVERDVLYLMYNGAGISTEY